MDVFSNIVTPVFYSTMFGGKFGVKTPSRKKWKYKYKRIINQLNPNKFIDRNYTCVSTIFRKPYEYLTNNKDTTKETFWEKFKTSVWFPNAYNEEQILFALW